MREDEKNHKGGTRVCMTNAMKRNHNYEGEMKAGKWILGRVHEWRVNE